MAMFVHLTAEKNVKAILRGGISKLQPRHNRPTGVFALPVSQDFFVSHQWLRELKRRGRGPIVAVYFRIPDEEQVWVGHYRGPHEEMTAAQAVALVQNAENPLGYEVIIPRRISKKDIHRVRPVPQVVGWRYYPGVHGKRPCGCDWCQRGLYGARRLREEYEKGF